MGVRPAIDSDRHGPIRLLRVPEESASPTLSASPKFECIPYTGGGVHESAILDRAAGRRIVRRVRGGARSAGGGGRRGGRRAVGG